jgi:signal transduction histidine kinase
MEADSLVLGNPTNSKLAELAALLEELVVQTRAVSYLFHPPLLDEMGFASAAKWFIEGYSQRTGIAVSAAIPKEAEHLPRHLELALFRILQEALTNTHRHSKSTRAEVSVTVRGRQAILTVRDFGKGIPPATLANFLNEGADVGVGLAGIKERVREFGGELKVHSDSSGTLITARMPVIHEIDSSLGSRDLSPQAVSPS